MGTRSPAEVTVTELQDATRRLRLAVQEIQKELFGCASPVEMMTAKYDWLRPIVQDVVLSQLFKKRYDGYEVADGPLRDEIRASARRVAGAIVSVHLNPAAEKEMIAEGLSKKLTQKAVRRAYRDVLLGEIEERTCEVVSQMVRRGDLDPVIAFAIKTTLREGRPPTKEGLMKAVLSLPLGRKEEEEDE